MFELQVPFFLPLWRRILTVAICFGWSIIEIDQASFFFGLVFIAMGVYASWQFFIADWPEKDANNSKDH